MYDIRAALSRAGVPCMRSTARRGEEGLPDTYATFSARSDPVQWQDDKPSALSVAATVRLVSGKNPTAAGAKIRREMADEGYELIYEEDDWAEGAKQYELISYYRALRFL